MYWHGNSSKDATHFRIFFFIHCTEIKAQIHIFENLLRINQCKWCNQNHIMISIDRVVSFVELSHLMDTHNMHSPKQFANVLSNKYKVIYNFNDAIRFIWWTVFERRFIFSQKKKKKKKNPLGCEKKGRIGFVDFFRM